MATIKSKKNVVIFNSLLWTAIGGAGIGFTLITLMQGKPLDFLKIVWLIVFICAIIASARGLHHWWGK